MKHLGIINTAASLLSMNMSESFLRAATISPIRKYGPGKRSVLNRRFGPQPDPYKHDREIARMKRQNPKGYQFIEYTRWHAKKFGDGGTTI